MWVPGSLAFLGPAVFLAARLLAPTALHRSPRAPLKAPKSRPPREPFDLLRAPLIGRLLRARFGRRALQAVTVGIAALVILDGLRGSPVAAMNLAGVLPWTYGRGLLVIGLLAAGNVFCMACPFTLPRDARQAARPDHAILAVRAALEVAGRRAARALLLGLRGLRSLGPSVGDSLDSSSATSSLPSRSMRSFGARASASTSARSDSSSSSARSSRRSRSRSVDRKPARLARRTTAFAARDGNAAASWICSSRGRRATWTAPSASTA